MSSQVGVGDLLRAWDAIGRDPTAVPALARMLALGEPEPGRAGTGAGKGAAPAVGSAAGSETSSAAPEKSTEVAPATGSAAEASGDRTPPGESPRDPIGDDFELPAALRVTELPAVAPDLPVWWTREELAPPASTSPASPGEAALPNGSAVLSTGRVAPASLFAPQRERALLSAATRMLRADGPIDTERLIQGYARRAPPRELPRLRIPSLAGGCQLILDRSPWMTPFSDDMAALSARLSRIAGDAFDELSVPGLPPDVQRLDDLDPAPWEPPPAGTAILVVSDVGRAARRRGNPVPGERWESFLRSISAASFAPIVIVPGRCSSEVCSLRNAKVIDWDRETRVAEVARFRKARWR